MIQPLSKQSYYENVNKYEVMEHKYLSLSRQDVLNFEYERRVIPALSGG